MTKVYNVTNYGVAEQLAEQVEKIENAENKTVLYKVPTKNGFVELNKNDLRVIARIINDQIFLFFPSLKSIYDYFMAISPHKVAFINS